MSKTKEIREKLKACLDQYGFYTDVFSREELLEMSPDFFKEDGVEPISAVDEEEQETYIIIVSKVK